MRPWSTTNPVPASDGPGRNQLACGPGDPLRHPPAEGLEWQPDLGRCERAVGSEVGVADVPAAGTFGPALWTLVGDGWGISGGKTVKYILHQNRQAQARWWAALEELTGRKLVELTMTRTGTGGNLLGWYTVRHEGYVAADELLKRRAARKAGSVNLSGDISAGSGKEGPGGHVVAEGGAGRHGADGGDVNGGPGNYKAGDGGKGPGGNIHLKGGDAEEGGFEAMLLRS
jgi:hypothetical protein